MPPMEIPGYYYDKEKSKYFKIEGSGNASNSAYTTEVVKKRQAHDKEEETQVKKAKRGLTGIKRAVNLDATLSGFSINRERGNRPDMDTPRRVLAEGLVLQGVLPTKSPSQWDEVVSAEPFFCVKYCSDKDEDIVQIHSGKDPLALISLVRLHKNGGTTLLNKSRGNLYGHSGRTTSLSYNEGSGLYAMTWLSGSNILGVHIRNDFDSDLAGLNFGPGTTRGPEVDIFSSTAAPSPSPFLFAFGTSRGILTLDARAQDLTWAKGCLARKSAIKSDYLALTFLSLPSSPSHGQTLLCGERSGLIRLVDFRDPSNPADRTEFFRHPSTITHIKQVSDHGILVSGLQSQLQQYDMRFLKPSSVSSVNKNSLLTTPILTYSHYKNSSHINVGLDVDLTTGIIAAAQDSTYSLTPRVQLLSLTTGNPLVSPSINQDLFYEEQQNQKLAIKGPQRYKPNGRGMERVKGWYKAQSNPPRCVKWNEDVEGQMKSLYVSDDTGTISRYAWKLGGEAEDEEVL